MSVLSLFRQLRGGRAFLLGIEGLPYAPTSMLGGSWTFATPGTQDPPSPGDWTPIGGVLQTEDLKASQSVQLDTSENRASDMTFRLVDGELPDGTRYGISSFMSREGAAARTYLTTTFDVSDADLEVQSAAAFPSSGYAYVGLETFEYSSKTGTKLESVTPAMFGSRERQHVFEAPVEGVTIADYGRVPEVTDRPTSLMGRRCWLYLAEANDDGTLQAAEIVWRGRITGELTANAEMEWVIPAESLLSALSTDLLGAQPSTVVKGIYLERDTTIHTVITNIWNETWMGDPDFVVDAGLYTIDELLAHITERFNAALDVAALSDDRWALTQANGVLLMEKTRENANPAVTSCYAELFVLEPFDEQLQGDYIAMGLVLGIVPHTFRDNSLGTLLRLPSVFGDVRRGGAVPRSVFVTGTGLLWVPVESKNRFTAYADWPGGGADGYRVESVVAIDGNPYLLKELHPTLNLIRVRVFTDHVEAVAGWGAQYFSDAPMTIVQGLWFYGEMPTVWRDAVLDNVNVPPEMVLGGDSRDFDWDDMAAQFPGGNISRRDRLLTGPTPFFDVLMEDWAHSGMAPVIGLNGLITCRPLGNTSLVRPDGEPLLSIDADTIDHDARPELSRSPKRVVNKYVVHAVREHGRPGAGHGDKAFDFECIINDKDSQERHRMVREVSRDFSGAFSSSATEIAADVYGVASTIFALLSRETDVLPIGPCNGIAYGVLPLDTVLITHWLPPDPTRTGERGLLALPAIVLSVEIDYEAMAVSLEVQLLVDNGQRSGFAPAARLTQYTDNGGGAGTRRHEVTVDTGRYTATDEAAFFSAGYLVVIRQWDTDTITVATESFSVSDVDAGAIFLDAAPSAGMQAEINADRALLTLEDYDAGGQASLALLYLHVADDADNLLGASGILGFKVS